MTFELVDGHKGLHVPVVRALFREYAEQLGIDLCFQGFEQELADLPGEYAPPPAAVLLLKCEGQWAGCVALRRIDETTCEMKRMFVRPTFRGRGLGRRLAEAVIERARAIGYERMRLDTLTSMAEANRLYESLGFRDMGAYRFNPLPTARFMELRLRETSAAE